MPRNPGAIAIAASLLVVGGSARAQTWSRTFASPSPQAATTSSISKTLDCGYYVGATISNGPYGRTDGVVRRLDAEGALLWERVFGTGQDESVEAVATATDGSLLVAGTANLALQGEHLFVLKISPSGSLIWQFAFWNTIAARGRDLAATPDGGAIAVADVVAITGDLDAWVLKLDRDLDLEWQRLLQSSESETPRDVLTLPGGGYVVAGERRVAVSPASWDLWAVRLDAIGDVVWQRAYGTNADETLTAALARADGAFALAGSRPHPEGGTNNRDALVLGLDAVGNVLWQRVYAEAAGSPSGDVVAALAEATGGGTVLAGSIERPLGFGNHNAWIAEVDAAGEIVWQRVYGRSGDDRVLSMERVGGDGYALSGFSSFVSAGETWALKLSPTGLLESGCTLERLGLITPTAGDLATRTSDVLSIVGNRVTNQPAFSFASATSTAALQCAGVPAEVSGSGASERLRFEDAITLSWEDASASGVTAYNLYRGDLAGLASGNYGACLEPALPTPSALDTDVPGLASSFTYLVTGLGDDGEGPMGCCVPCGGPRGNGSPCP